MGPYAIASLVLLALAVVFLSFATLLKIVFAIVGLVVLLFVVLIRAGEGGFTLRESTRRLLFPPPKKEHADQPHSHGNGPAHTHTHPWDRYHRSKLHKFLLLLHCYIYSSCIVTYIKMALSIGRRYPKLAQKMALTYHGKVLSLDDAKLLISPPADTPGAIDVGEKVLPYPVARDLLLRRNQKVVALDCPCRISRVKHCTPVDVCLIVGGAGAVQYVIEHNPGHAKEITQEQALKVLEEEHARGHAHIAYFKDAMKDQFFALCNCCKCCCGGIEMMRDCGAAFICSSGLIAKVDVDTCVGCGKCEASCPFGAIRTGVPKDARDKEEKALIDNVKCMGCGACQTKCSRKAIELVRDPTKPEVMDIKKMALTW